MRTTLKRGVGRGAELNGNGHAVYPPAAVSAVARYEQPLRPGRTGLALVGRILLVTLLAVPRDLIVPIYCKTGFVTDDRINSAFSRCGSTGTLETVKHLTGLPVNYLIKVDFHGFKEIVDQLGGVWMDVDRRYYNRNTGSYATNFANINLQPGYQQLGGGSAPGFVRYRHTDSDLYRLARQQEVVRAFKAQVATSFDLTKLQGMVSTVTHRLEV